jgi:D-alanine-D-alanine ligase
MTATANKEVVILYNQVLADAPKDEQDVLVQVEVVSRALAELGYHPHELGFSLSINETIKALKEINPVFVFNLTESVEGDGRLIYLAASLLDHLAIPYTGCSTEALFLTSNKLLTKKMLYLAGIDTPQWVSIDYFQPGITLPAGHYISKSVWEHASNWFTADSIISFALEPAAGTLKEILKKQKQQTGKEFFIERYIDGREFNISILAGEVLAVPEIKFLNYPGDKFKVVDYRAKWEEESFEFHHTPRSFDFPPADDHLLEKLRRISRQCWDLFDLKGYARVDFRVDSDGRPWVLELNANPCISPDSGFYAAAERSGLPFSLVVEKIIGDSLR